MSNKKKNHKRTNLNSKFSAVVTSKRLVYQLSLANRMLLFGSASNHGIYTSFPISLSTNKTSLAGLGESMYFFNAFL